jgi:hypothetical protein
MPYAPRLRKLIVGNTAVPMALVDGSSSRRYRWCMYVQMAGAREGCLEGYAESVTFELHPTVH